MLYIIKTLVGAHMHVFFLALFNNLIYTALSRQKSKAFRLWVNKTIESKDRGQIEEHSRLLISNAASHTR